MIAMSAVILFLADAPANSFDDWQWDRKSPICVLRQDVGPSESVVINRTPANDEVELKISVRANASVREGRIHGVSIEPYPNGQSIADAVVGKDGSKISLTVVTPDPAFIENLSKASAIGFSDGKSAPLRIGIHSAELAVEGLRACENDKMRAWGIDPLAWWSLRSRPMPIASVRDRFSALDYPVDALAAGVEFDAIIRLDVTTDGRVGKCTGLNRGSYKGFETASCAVLKGASFRPAVDQAGNPVSAPIVYDVRFRIDN